MSGEKFTFDPNKYDSFQGRDVDAAQKARREKRQAAQAMQSEKKAKKEKRRVRLTKRTGVVGIIFLVVLCILVLAGGSIKQIITLNAEKNALEEKHLLLEKKLGALEEELTLVNTDEYIEQQARSQLHMIKKGEILYLYQPFNGENQD